MESKNPIQVAGEVGRSLAGNIGESAFIELELAYATRLLPRFSDDPITRVNQNVLLYWQRSYYKSTILRVFRQTIPDNLKTIDITSMSLEKIFGSIDEKRKHIIDPAFTSNVCFVIISELTALLGRGDTMKHFADTMNYVLEGERTERRTLKLGFGEIKEEELDMLEKKGVHYDSIEGVIWYTPNVCVFAATRPLDNRYFTFLNTNGYFNRFHVIQYHVTNEEASLHLHKDFKLDQKALDKLKELNALLSNVKAAKISRPSEELMKPLYNAVEELVKDEIRERKDLEFASIITPRLKDDLIRELVAHAFVRTAFQNGFNSFDELHYTQEDVNFIGERLYHFIDFLINPSIAEEFTWMPRKNSKTSRAEKFILELLADKKVRAGYEIVASVDNAIGCKPATAYNALKKLKTEGKICEPTYGFYKLKEDCKTCTLKDGCGMTNIH